MSDRRFAPEERALLDAVSAGLRAAFGLDVPRGRGEQRVDPRALVRLASLHGVVGPAYDGCRAGAALPAEAAEALHELRDRQVSSSVRLAGELVRLADRFAAAGIPVLPMKGPLFAQRVYGNLSRRSYWDLDLLLHPGSVLRAKELMLADGYDPEYRWSPRREARELRRNCEYNFDHPRTRVHVELHWRFMEPTIGFDFPTAGVWERAQRVAFLGRDLPAVSSEDDALALLVHNGAKHGWQRLRMIADVAAVMLRFSPSECERLFVLATRAGVRRILSTGTLLASRLLDLPLAHAAEFAACDPPRERVLHYYEAELFRFNVDRHPDALDRARAYLASRERRMDRLRYLPSVLRAVVTPTDREQELLPLPPRWRWLHVVVRPFRLAWKYAAGRRSRS